MVRHLAFTLGIETSNTWAMDDDRLDYTGYPQYDTEILQDAFTAFGCFGRRGFDSSHHTNKPFHRHIGSVCIAAPRTPFCSPGCYQFWDIVSSPLHSRHLVLFMWIVGSNFDWIQGTIHAHRSRSWARCAKPSNNRNHPTWWWYRPPYSLPQWCQVCPDGFISPIECLEQG